MAPKVIANLQLAHGLQLGDRVVILATKQQPKAGDRFTEDHLNSLDVS